MMARKSKKWTMIFIGFIVVVLFTLALTKLNIAMEKGLSVTSIDVDKQDISSYMMVQGKLESKIKSEISSDFSYRINDIYVKVGDKVKKGEVLAKFDIKELNFDIECAKLELEIQEEQYKEKNSEENILSLKKDIENQEIDVRILSNKYERNKILYESGVVAKDELETSYDEYIKSKNSLEKNILELNKIIKEKDNKSDLKALELKKINLTQKIENISKSTVVSPIDGTITAVNARIGSMPKGTEGLFIIEDLSKLKATFYINEFDISQLKIGRTVELTTESIQNKTFEGKITNIYPTAQVEQNAASGKQIVIPVEVELTGDIAGLRPGLTIESKIETQIENEVLVLPYEAIYEKVDKTNCVFLVDSGMLKEIPVELGVESDLLVQIIADGIKVGDKVVLNPDETYSDGMKVNIDEYAE